MASPTRAVPVTLDELAILHASDERFIKAKLSQLSKPKLGQKPLTKDQIEEQTAKITNAMREKQALERLELDARIATEAAYFPAVTGVVIRAELARSDKADDYSAPIDRVLPVTPLAVQFSPAGPGSTGTRAERRRQKKADERASDELEAAAAMPSPGLSPKDIELEQLRKQLAKLGYGVRPIAADGNCLFRAVSDQLSSFATTAAASTPSLDHMALRRMAIDHIRLHPTDFGPFLPYEASDAFPEGISPPAAAVQAAVDRYCVRMSRPGLWGGHPELRALATSLMTPIVVHEAGAPTITLLPMTDAALRLGEFSGASGSVDLKPLQLSYHRYYYALGEHYNSVVQN